MSSVDCPQPGESQEYSPWVWVTRDGCTEEGHNSRNIEPIIHTQRDKSGLRVDSVREENRPSTPDMVLSDPTSLSTSPDNPVHLSVVRGVDNSGKVSPEYSVVVSSSRLFVGDRGTRRVSISRRPTSTPTSTPPPSVLYESQWTLVYGPQTPWTEFVHREEVLCLPCTSGGPTDHTSSTVGLLESRPNCSVRRSVLSVVGVLSVEGIRSRSSKPLHPHRETLRGMSCVLFTSVETF